MNGWQRLGIVLGTVLAVPVGIIAYENGKRAYAYHDPSPRVSKMSGQAWVDAVFEEAKQENRELRGCILSTTTVTQDSYGGDQATISCERNTSNAAFDALLWMALPYIIVFGIGYTIGWVYRGFRPKTQ